jgi:hypothetical protein
MTLYITPNIYAYFSCYQTLVKESITTTFTMKPKKQQHTQGKLNLPP